MNTASPSIVHSVPGRVRLRLATLKADATLRERLDALFATDERIRWGRVNPGASSVVVGYAPDAMVPEDVLTLVAEAAGVSACALADAERGDGPACACAPRLQTASLGIRPKLLRFAGLTVLGGALFLMPASAPVLALRVAGGLFALPVILRGAHEVAVGKPGLTAFLGTGLSVALLSGELAAVVEILWIEAGADVLTALIAERSRRNIAAIVDMTAHHTFVLVDGVEVEREVNDLVPGDIVVLHAGEKACVDGVVTDGHALVDEAPLTGRPDLVDKTPGEAVHAGTFVRQGVVFVRAECVGDTTFLARILRDVEDAAATRAPVQLEADRLARRTLHMGVAATAGTLLVTGSFSRALAVMLVMACPCATVLAASTAVSAAICAASRRGILIKGGRYLEEAARCEAVYFDKTGTLTESEPVLEQIVSVDGCEERTALSLAFSAEMHNHHPVARAIKTAAMARGIDHIQHDLCEYHLGRGVEAHVRGHRVLIGNTRMLSDHGVDVTPFAEPARELVEAGLTVLYLAVDNAPCAIFGIGNAVRPHARDVVAALGGEVHLLTGDEPPTAKRLAAELGIHAVHAGVLPDDKARIVREGAAHRQVMMVGDGINDAPALVEAQVGVAMGGGGAEAAVEAADIVLTHDDVRGVVAVQDLSRRTLTVIHQSFWFAQLMNLGGAAAAAAGLLSPATAGLLHVLHTSGILANSARLLSIKPMERTLPDRAGK